MSKQGGTGRLGAWIAGLLLLSGLAAPPAEACLSCGCGGSGMTSDLGSLGGAASVFSQGHQWLFQFGLTYRSITGTFNERGEWNPRPVGGSLNTYQGSAAVMFFPSVHSSIGLQVPILGNSLTSASWGTLGSIKATNTDSSGFGAGDISLQGTYTFLETGNWAMAGWAALSFPTGNSTGAPGQLTGSGVVSGLLGVMAFTQLGNWEVGGNVGYQRPFATPSQTTSAFYVGESLLYQLQTNYKINDAWRLGAALNGQWGRWQLNANSSLPTSRLTFTPSVQYNWSPERGIRVGVGLDSPWGTNSLTSWSLNIVFFNFLS